MTHEQCTAFPRVRVAFTQGLSGIEYLSIHRSIEIYIQIYIVHDYDGIE